MECYKKVLFKVKKNLDAKNYQIVSIGFSGQMHSLVMLDKNNNQYITQYCGMMLELKRVQRN